MILSILSSLLVFVVAQFILLLFDDYYYPRLFIGLCAFYIADLWIFNRLINNVLVMGIYTHNFLIFRGPAYVLAVFVFVSSYVLVCSTYVCVYVCLCVHYFRTYLSIWRNPLIHVHLLLILYITRFISM